MTDAPSTKAHRELTITRVLDAPREVVWRAWTEPEQFAYWFGAELEVPLATVSLDVKPGGAWKAPMISEDGSEMPFGGLYREVDEPERLVFTFEEAGASDDERQVLTVTFKDVGGKTEVTLTHAGTLEQEHFDGLQGGYNSFFDKLEELLAKK
ncbi:MAG: SRPBCC family protein [Gaiellaceae bacterium]